MSRPKKQTSAAEGKRFGTTTIAPEKSMFDIQSVLAKYQAEASQWTVLSDRYDLRFRINERNYLFTIPKTSDSQEVKRLLRVVFWYLDTMLAAIDAGQFTVEKVFLAFAEVAPDVTLSEVIEDGDRFAQIRTALGGAQWALQAGGDAR